MVRRITSKDNFIMKRMKQLEARKFRDKFNQFVIEGPTVLKEAIKEGIPMSFVAYCDGFLMNDDSQQIIDSLLDSCTPVYSMENRLFALISGTETPQGVIAVAQKPEWNRNELKEKGANLIVLDRVSDPGNMGTIIRTAEAAGFKGIIVLKGSVDPYSGKVSRAAAGALMRMPIYNIENPEELLSLMKENNKKLICTDPRSTDYYYDIDMARDTAIIIGNEASGVCSELMDKADLKTSIPMEGKTESLNAAVAACILMYESLRQKNIQKIVL